MAAEPGPAPDRAADTTAARPAADTTSAPTSDTTSDTPSAPRGFAGWRGRRPFWGGLLVALAGGEILFTEKAPMRMVIRIGMLGLAGYLVPALMVLCGLLLIFHPVQRVFYSLIAVLATLGSWVTSNLGGFFVGLLLGLVGSSLAFGWLPDQPRRRRLLRREPRRGTDRATGGGADGGPERGPERGPAPEATPA
ncbi:DUF6114 domain-containing protein [Kitasatospora phosalacinea]|uniref:Uncharacterized protein n=1 Tax=Kitasatospora phosalacinea TaxID=2065 RepID=A0A9W6PMU6_9ACTN|nr:DUF6114 domain-containing protein [Kitasatospora phosalacinea]GLW57921.1 hypothetical protein Kpho01_59320 [Kitasatospora phosalacinea]